MKTKLLSLAVAGVALAGCAKVEITGTKDSTEKNLITFASPVTGKNVNTKANYYGEIGNIQYEGSNATYSYPKNENFIIFAVEHEGDLQSDAWGTDNAPSADFNGQTLTYDPMLDSWAPKTTAGGYYYWPDNKNMSFAAVSPADMGLPSGATPTYGPTGLKIENFTVPAEPAYQFDLLFSQRASNTTADNMNHSASSYSGIPLTFQHALTSIHFSIKTEEGVTIYLNKITLQNVKSKGTFTENIEEGGDASKYERDVNVKPGWAVVDDSKTSYVAFEGEVQFPYEAQYVSAVAANTDGGNTSHSLLIMPQKIDEDVKLIIEYTVGGQKKQSEVVLNSFADDAPKEWIIGTKYTYRLYYSKASEKQDIISFGPSTSDWADGKVHVIELK